MKLRDWSGSVDTLGMQRLASRLWPTGPHPGGLGWAMAIGQLADQVELAESDAGLVGWAGLSGADLQLAVDPARAAVAADLMGWALDQVVSADLTVTVAERDDTIRTAVLSMGFAPVPETEPAMGMRRAATPNHPTMPAGYTIRGVAPDEANARVAVHRAAWRPAALPWPPGDRPAIPPDATSSFTATHYEEVRRTWLYDAALDLVVVAPDGTLVGCCIAWWDAAIGCAEIEPLGVVPDHRRLGLAGSLCLAVAAQVSARGGDEVFINTGPNIEYWVPSAAYAKVGFTPITRTCSYRRPTPR